MNKLLRQWGAALLAGASIGIAATVYLKVGGIIGAFLFGFGLLTVITLQFNLFTGKAQYAWNWYKSAWITFMLLFNILGTYLVAKLTMPDVSQSAQAIIQSRMSMEWWRCGLMAIPCGFIMTAAVRAAKENNWWVLFMGVPTFILCGFPHCVADAFYMWSIDNFSDFLWPRYVLIVIGNFLGCNLYRISYKPKTK